MNKLSITLPEGIDFDKPHTITKAYISEYYDKIKEMFGNFCGDCEHLIEDNCKKKHRPRKYELDLGPFEFAVLKKNCADFELFLRDIDEKELNLSVQNALDCSVQQYCN